MFDFWILGINARNILYIKKFNDKKGISLADNKEKTKLFLSERGIPTGETYAMIRSKTELSDFHFDSIPSQEFVIKPNKGSKGEWILIVTRLNEEDFLVGKEIVDEIFLRRVMTDILDGAFSISGSKDSILIEEKLIPNEAFRPFCEHGLADIRMIVFNLVPIASMVRIPTKESWWKANLAQGGVGMGIDISDGTITSILLNRRNYTRNFPQPYESFPSKQIPYWDDILLYSSKIQFFVNLGYLALDWVITDKGPKLLEINARAGLELQNVSLIPLKTRLDKVSHIRTNDPEKGVEITKTLFGRHKTSLGIKQSEILYFSQTGKLSLKKNGETETEIVEIVVDTSIERNEISERLLGKIKQSEKSFLEIDDSEIRFENTKYSIRANAETNQIFLGRKTTANYYVKPVPKEKSKARELFWISNTEWSSIVRFDKELRVEEKKLNLSKALNPINKLDELDAFVSAHGRYDPIFVYNFPDRKFTDGIRIKLDELKKRYDRKHFKSPILALYQEKIDELSLKCDLIDAYRNQNYPKIHAIDSKIYGSIKPELLKESVSRIFERIPSDESLLGPILSHEEIETIAERYFQERDMPKIPIDWSNTVLSRVAVSYGNIPKIIISKQAVIRQNEFLAIFAHEVETHLQRGLKGAETGLDLLKHGTGFYLEEEEGLAVYKSLEKLPEGYEKNAMYEKYFLVSEAGHRSFSELADIVRTLEPEKTLERVFNTCLRLKKWVMRTSDRAEWAFYGKNKIYLNGYMKIKQWTESGWNLEKMLIGKIKIEDIKYLGNTQS